jgi:hypothetical protein
MRLRLLLVLCLVPAFILVSGAAGSATGNKYKITLSGAVAICTGVSCDPSSVVVMQVSDPPRTPCRVFVDFGTSICRWTARAGTKVVFETQADPPFSHHSWVGDCTGTGKCTLIMDSNKSIGIDWTAP